MSYDHRLWDGIVPELLALGFRVVRFDQRGHGRSPVSAPFRFEEVVEDLHALIGELGLERPILGGLSFGGFVAMGSAVARPDQVAGLILADTCSFPSPNDDEMAETLPASADGVEALAKWWEERQPAPKPEERPAFERERDRFTEHPADGLRNAILACAARIPVTGELGRITAPTLVIAGESDHIFSPASHAALAAGIPGARLVILPDAGHISCLDDPEGFNRAVRDFLESRVD